MSEQSDQPSRKRTKQIDTWFLRSNRQSSNSIGSSQASVSTPIFAEQQQPLESPVVNSQTQSIEFEPEVNSNVLERDPATLPDFAEPVSHHISHPASAEAPSSSISHQICSLPEFQVPPSCFCRRTRTPPSLDSLLS
ncbi:hypothetical protein M0R45_036695 [Rubus argutus]|uniref:Uncharacterized protein n=1 Tax=Rubus argutus TaxID=59490 RepID=A0AAW1W0N5_RUBAR